MMDQNELDIRLNAQAPHVCIRFFKDDQVAITDPGNLVLAQAANSNLLVKQGINYHHVIMFNNNPTCVWHRGILYCTG